MSEENSNENLEIIENNVSEVVESNVENENNEVVEKPVEEVYKPWKAEKKIPETIPYSRFSETIAEKNILAQKNAELLKELEQFKRVKETVNEIKSIEDINMDKPIPEYHQDLVTFIENKLDAKYRAEREAEKFQEMQSKKIQDFSRRMEDVKDVNPEISDAAAHVGQYVDQIPQYIQDSIVEDENGPWLLWELATQKGLIEQLSNSSPANALRTLGKLSAKYDNRNSKDVSQKQVTKEPVKDIPVMKPKASTPNIRSENNINSTNYSNQKLSKMSTAEYKEWVRKRGN